MRHTKIAVHLFILLSFISCGLFEGPTGPKGPVGPQGESLPIQVKVGIISEENYTPQNPLWASIPLAESGKAPTVLWFAIRNSNDLFVSRTSLVAAVGWTKRGSDFAVPGHRGWHVSITDPTRSLIGELYEIKFVQ